MPVLKKATARLHAAGVRLEVHSGLYGPYLYNPALMRQTGKVYPTIESAVQAALAGEAPRPVGTGRGE